MVYPDSERHIKGRGAQKHLPNRFESYSHETLPEFEQYRLREGDPRLDQKTKFQKIFPKTVVNKVNSPDVGLSYSMNPYQGCEHGCVYCYARNTHEYWGFGDTDQALILNPVSW